MKIKQPQERTNLKAGELPEKAFTQFCDLVNALNQHEIPDSVAEAINREIAKSNDSDDTSSLFIKDMMKARSDILEIAKQDLGLTPPGYFQSQWMALGIGAFGLPIGVALGLATQNMGLLAVGLPIGIGVGLAIGAGMDKKAKEEGRQLDL